MNKIIKLSIVLLLALSFLLSAGCYAVNGEQGSQSELHKGEITSLNILGGGRLKIGIGEELELKLDVPDELLSEVEWSATNDNVTVSDSGNVTGMSEGKVTVSAKYGEHKASVLIEVLSISDYYEDVEKEEFYEDYEPAQSYMEAYWRTEHGLMSGSVEDQHQEPSISDYRPKQNGLFVRNTSSYYEDGGNTYVVIDAYGNEVTRVYRGGAYVILEEVAAYLFAFGDVPANYVEGKSKSPTTSIWGEYLRLNHSYFSGDTERYPYEPVLPDISGCGGDLKYYEVDIGTLGTDCDPAYSAAPYNNGSSIIRGAARIVYTRYDKNGDNIIDINEKYLFYTYNHYNDFQEYLNYFGGWGEMFGNVTGGGEISSKTDYAPTEYVPTARAAIVWTEDSAKTRAEESTIIICCNIDILRKYGIRKNRI